MKKIDKSVADSYFKTRTRNIAIYLAIGFIVSFVVAAFAESFSGFNVLGMPFHYWAGAQGAVITFVVLLFINAYVSDKIDEKYGIDEKRNEALSAGKTFDH
ncbi:DUF4212 domain-containing protein [Calidifontibacillus erzurumensis]|uniref:DUF4212 domain-containing protein n=1 Tax=Calidifontibacillus erzurumensis TaxID=2741433 RepID=A0A8J8KBL2_9BACI|nr:DUF4212 domain-containing protein [Calidifontibacillus erzurumensis]NSL52059.1 DUF4212 domain-containing protein [Calidifontibacillus erzurumensis]